MTHFRPTIWCFLIVIPSIVLGSLGFMLNKQYLTELPLAVVDLDHSYLSRKWMRALNDSPSIDVVAVMSATEAQKKLHNGDVYGFVLIPKDFGANLVKGSQPTLKTVLDGRKVLVTKVLGKAIATVNGQYKAISTAAGVKALVGEERAAQFSAAPIRAQLTAVSNQTGNYGQFLLPAMFAAVWQLLLIVTTVVYLTERPRDSLGSDNGWSSGDRSFKDFIDRSFELTPWLALQGGVAFIVLYAVFGWPFWGNILVTAGVIFLATLAGQSLAMAVCMLITDPTRAVSIVGAIAAPSFAFLGATFPTIAMPQMALIWRSFLPAAHFTELFIAQANYGSSVTLPTTPIWSLMVFLLLPIIAYRIRRRSIANAA